MDKGFLFNLKALVLEPKKLTDDYIIGKRKGVQNPISFLIVCVTIYLIVVSQIEPNIVGLSKVPDNMISRSGGRFGAFLASYLKYFWILMILPLALSTKLTF